MSLLLFNNNLLSSKQAQCHFITSLNMLKSNLTRHEFLTELQKNINNKKMQHVGYKKKIHIVSSSNLDKTVICILGE